MQFQVVAVGKLRPALREVCDDYLRRLRRFVPVSEHEVREAGRAPSVNRRRELEGEHLIAVLPTRATVVLLDSAGEAWSSEELAARVERWRIDGNVCAFIVGGAEGVSSAIRHRARISWSLGAITLPHELARVVAVEQLYRASTILRGEPYHKGVR
ncbi:MAG TPA: 23S rRNA (pseudouridine(1915)-N(3))-methyltransferase RlmH [Gemmatimonadales bacterium]|jgi:23S rRNA (pseudouridine1915-N3)-methyltransferase